MLWIFLGLFLSLPVDCKNARFRRWEVGGLYRGGRRGCVVLIASGADGRVVA